MIKTYLLPFLWPKEQIVSCKHLRAIFRKLQTLRCIEDFRSFKDYGGAVPAARILALIASNVRRSRS